MFQGSTEIMDEDIMRLVDAARTPPPFKKKAVDSAAALEPLLAASVQNGAAQSAGPRRLRAGSLSPTRRAPSKPPARRRSVDSLPGSVAEPEVKG